MPWDTLRDLRAAIDRGDLPAHFSATQVNKALGLNWTGAFLSRHSVGNRGGYLELFICVRQGLYRLKE